MKKLVLALLIAISYMPTQAQYSSRFVSTFSVDPGLPGFNNYDGGPTLPFDNNLLIILISCGVAYTAKKIEANKKGIVAGFPIS